MFQSSRSDPTGLAALLLVGILSGSAFMFTRLAVEDLGPGQLALGRIAFGVIPVFAVMALTRAWTRLTPSFMRRITVLAILDTVAPLLLIAWAGSRIESSTAAVLVSTMPLFTVGLAAATTDREGITATAVGGLAAGFAGVLVLAGPEALTPGSSNVAGIIAVIGGAFCYAAGAVYARGLLKVGDPVSVTGVKLVTALLVTAVIVAPTEGVSGFGTMSGQTWIAVIVLGVGSTGLGRCVYLWIVRRSGSVQASLVTYIVPVVALFLGWTVMGESMPANKLAGAALIVAGVIGVSYGKALTRSLVAARNSLHRQSVSVPAAAWIEKP